MFPLRKTFLIAFQRGFPRNLFGYVWVFDTLRPCVSPPIVLVVFVCMHLDGVVVEGRFDRSVNKALVSLR